MVERGHLTREKAEFYKKQTHSQMAEGVRFHSGTEHTAAFTSRYPNVGFGAWTSVAHVTPPSASDTARDSATAIDTNSHMRVRSPILGSVPVCARLGLHARDDRCSSAGNQKTSAPDPLVAPPRRIHEPHHRDGRDGEQDVARCRRDRSTTWLWWPERQCSMVSLANYECAANVAQQTPRADCTEA